VNHGDDLAVDIDRLADYAAGALDRAAAAEVSHLIATRPVWADAYLALVAADAATRAELRSYARSHLEPMPADVIARLDDAFDASAAIVTRATRGEPAHVSRLDQARRRRRLVSFATAAAAAVIVIAGFGVVSGLIQPATNQAGSSAGRGNSYEQADGAGAGAGPPVAAPSGAFGGRPLVFSSGTDYGPDTLSSVLTVAAGAPRGLAGTARPSTETKGVAPPLVDADKLLALMDGSSLQTCLAAVTRSQPGSVAVVDFARYEGRPAVVVLIRDGGGGSGVVVVVGPDCGGTDADVRAVQRLP